MTTHISRDLWLKALTEAGESVVDDQSATTTTEFMQMFGVNRMTAKRRMDKLVKAGKATRTTKRERLPDGRILTCVGYLLVPDGRE